MSITEAPNLPLTICNININKIETITGTLLPHKPLKDGEPIVTQKFKFTDSIESIPFYLDEGQTYIITAWDCNHYIKAVDRNNYKIIESHGSQLEVDKEYLLIKTRY